MIRRHNALRTALAAAIVSGALAVTAHAHADDDDGAAKSDALIEHALALRVERRDAEALAELEEAERLAPSPRAHAQVALANQALGRWVKAESGLREALATSDPWIEKNRAALEAAAATTGNHLGWLDAETNVPGATLFVDGEARGAFPLSGPVRMVAGAAVVEVRAPGYQSASRRIDITPGAHAREVFTLVAVKAPLASERPAPSAPTDRPSHRSSTAAWVTLAVAGALVGEGIAATLVHNTNASIYDDDSRCLTVPGKTRDMQCGSYATTARVATGLAIAGFAAGAAAGAASAYFFLRGDEAPSAAGVRAARCTLHGLGVVCGVRF